MNTLKIFLIGMIGYILGPWNQLNTNYTANKVADNAEIVNRSGNNSESFIDGPCSFSATIDEHRIAGDGKGNEVFLSRFNTVSNNIGNSFKAYTGTFQAPADGVYHISGSFLIDTYRCHLRPITFNVSVIKNENERIESFHLPIIRYVPLPNDSYPRDYTHNRKFDLLLQLKANDAIRLKIQTKQCVENLPVYFSKVIFSGYKIY